MGSFGACDFNKGAKAPFCIVSEDGISGGWCDCPAGAKRID
jgi:hypothetical protein